MTLRFSVFVAGSLYGVTTDRTQVAGLYTSAAVLGVPSMVTEVIA